MRQSRIYAVLSAGLTTGGRRRLRGRTANRGMSLLHQMLRRLLIALVTACSLAAACSGSSGRDARYPRRRPGCDLVIYKGLPTGGWDDIGPAEVGCYLDESEITCLGRLRVEACRMGGDIIYNVPKKALRPVERGMVYRGMVAHTRVANKTDDGPAPSPDAGSGAIEPLPSAAAAVATPPPAARDAGTH